MRELATPIPGTPSPYSNLAGVVWLALSADDKRLNGLIPQSNAFASYSLIEGSVIKQVGDGAGNITSNVYMLSGGMVNKLPDVKINVNGDTQQAVVEYQIIFALASRAIQ